MNELPKYVLRRPVDYLEARVMAEGYQSHFNEEWVFSEEEAYNSKLFVELDVSRLSTDIEQELVQLHLDSEREGTGIGRIITQEDIRAIAERIVGLLTQPQKEQK